MEGLIWCYDLGIFVWLFADLFVLVLEINKMISNKANHSSTTSILLKQRANHLYLFNMSSQDSEPGATPLTEPVK